MRRNQVHGLTVVAGRGDIAFLFADGVVDGVFAAAGIVDGGVFAHFR